jgi:PAS domain S-box-containing protein
MASVLVVDDERGIRETLKEFLRDAGNEVFLAADVAEGQKVLVEHAIDVIVLDLVLPREGGLDLLRYVHEHAPEVETIMMTGEPTMDTTVTAMRLGAFDFLAKPIGGNQICSVVEQAAQKKARRDETKRALRESEARFKRLTENAQDMIWRADLNGRVEYVNPAVKRLLDRAPEEVLGTQICSLIRPESALLIRRWVEAVLRADRSHDQLSQEVEYVHRSGRAVPCELKATVVRDDQGAAIAFEGIARDETKRKLTEARLRQSQRLEAIGQLAKGLAHDMNNILGAIMASASVVEREDELRASGAEDVRSILAACHRGRALTRNLMKFAHPEKVAHELFVARELAQATRDVLRRTIPRNIEVSASIDPDLWPVEGDEGLIGQALMNMALNSIDAMPQGGTLVIRAANVVLDEEARVDWGDVAAGRYVLLEVVDTGTGVDRATLERVFEPFFTTKPEREGGGMGLSIVYGVARSHGGTARLRSELGAGTAASLLLPAARGAAEPEHRRETPIPRPRRDATVLLVDDERLIRYAGRRILKKLGYTVLLAEDGQDAIEVFQEFGDRISLVILDVAMPTLDGRQAFRALRALDPEIKVIVASGFVADDRVEELLADGASGFVEKPFDLDQLSRKIDEALG